MACANSVSAARLFLQITSRRTLSSPAAAASPLLDILLPPPAAAASRFFFGSSSSSRRAIPTCTAGPLLAPPRANNHPRRHAAARSGGTGPHPANTARFSVTPARRETKTLYNPQRDEDGNEMSLEITPRAAKVPDTGPLTPPS